MEQCVIPPRSSRVVLEYRKRVLGSAWFQLESPKRTTRNWVDLPTKSDKRDVLIRLAPSAVHQCGGDTRDKDTLVRDGRI